MKALINKLQFLALFIFSSLVTFAQGEDPTGRGGASGDDTEWIKFLVIGLVVGAIIGFLVGKNMGSSKK